MALLLNAEEEQFRDSVRRFVAERSPLAKLRELMESEKPYHADVWQRLSDQLGLSALIIPAAYGGAEAGYTVLTVALTELGAGLVSSPLLAGTLAAGVLLQLDDKDAQARLLPGIASGEVIATLALAGDVTVRSDGGRLTGSVTPVLIAPSAGDLSRSPQDLPAEPARSGQPRGPAACEGLGLRLLDEAASLLT